MQGRRLRSGLALLTSMRACTLAARVALAAALAVAWTGCTWIDEDALEKRLAHGDSADTAAPDTAATCRAALTEALPDDTEAVMAVADSSLTESTAEDIGAASPIGCVDVVSGTIVFGAASGWNGTNDSDAYAFAVPAPARLRLTASWPDATADLDFGVWSLGEDGTTRVDLFSANGPSNCIGSGDPEVCTSAIALTPSESEDRPYQLVALGYLGEGDEPYTLELEWLEP